MTKSKPEPEPVPKYQRLRHLQLETGSVHRAVPKTRITGRSATAAETRDPEPRSHRKASTWPAYSAPQNHPTTHQRTLTSHLVGKILHKTLRRRRNKRRVRRTRKERDRKSTRLNSSHMSISYAVFCLKKK